MAQGMLDRSFGVGGNALIVLGTTAEGLLPVRCLDAEGDDFPITANAVRCVARYATDSGAVSANEFFIECGGQKTRVQIIDSINVRVDLGMPFSRREGRRDPGKPPRVLHARHPRPGPLGHLHTHLAGALVRHDLRAGLLVSPSAGPRGKSPRRQTSPRGHGIGFVQVVSREELRLRTWEAPGEPPADESACAAAALVAAVVNGFTDRELFARLKGGALFLQWEEPDNRLWVTGPGSYVFTGTWDFAMETTETKPTETAE